MEIYRYEQKEGEKHEKGCRLVVGVGAMAQQFNLI